MSLKELKKLLPKPSGYKVLLALPTKETKTAGGIYKPDELVDREHTASIVGCVMLVGPDAYKNDQKFPSGPWCKEGDWVLFKSYSGTRFKVKDQEFRFINDDTVDGVVDDPRIVERA